MGLFTPAWKSKDKKKAIEAVEKLTDQSVLKKVALNDSHKIVRRTAVGNITNQPFLKEVALNDSHLDVCLVSVNNITDQSFLKEIALKASHIDVCLFAVRKITEQSILAELALTRERSLVFLLKKMQDGKKVKMQDLVTASAQKLIELYSLSPKGEGFLTDSNAVEPVRAVGKLLNNTGGFQLMLHTHGQFAASYSVYGAARNLEMVWDGIGSWRG